jgi:hypothetical protein
MFYLPLIVATSLVMAATRHEKQELILSQALRTGFWITAFMIGISALLWLASLWI